MSVSPPRSGGPSHCCRRGAAASFAGCLAWQALARAAREAHPGLVNADILDCADASGRALEALRLGQQILVLDERSVGFADVCGRAAAMGATVLPVCVPHAFDPGLVFRRALGLRRALAAHLDAHLDAPRAVPLDPEAAGGAAPPEK